MSLPPPESKTPPRTDETKPVPDVTPRARGSGSNQAFETHTTQKEYKEYLVADLENCKTISFDEFLTVVFGLDSNWRTNPEFKKFETIATSRKFTELLKQYPKSTRHETQRYHPFNVLANYIFDELAAKAPLLKEEPVVFCRNDHIPIKGSHAKRIPDCVVVSKKASEPPNRKGWQNMAERGPEDVPFHWSEVLAFIEFKVKGHSKAPRDSKRKTTTSKDSRTSSRVSRSEQLKQSDAPSTCMSFIFLFRKAA